MDLATLIGFFIPEMKANFGSQEFEKSHPGYYAIVGFIVLVFSVPGVVLLGARGRAAFAGNGE